MLWTSSVSSLLRGDKLPCTGKQDGVYPQDHLRHTHFQADTQGYASAQTKEIPARKVTAHLEEAQTLDDRYLQDPREDMWESLLLISVKPQTRKLELSAHPLP